MIPQKLPHSLPSGLTQMTGAATTIVAERSPWGRTLATRALTDPPRLWSRAEVLTRPCPIPRSPGVYAWYFRTPPTCTPLDGCLWRGNMALLYVGISPRKPPANGRPGSRQTLASGNAAGSTLRLTLGCLLADELGLELPRVGRGQRLTFTINGEQRLSEWMARHAFVAWTEDSQPWLLEGELLRTLSVPLNLDGNRDHPFRQHLSALRVKARAQGRAFPLWVATTVDPSKVVGALCEPSSPTPATPRHPR